jgi:signal transduction histidine kinase
MRTWAPPAPDNSTAAARPLRVLCIEDSELDYQLMLHTVIADWPDAETVRVEDESNLVEALRNTAWDIVLSDHQLPDLTSSRALELVQQWQAGVPFIIVSGQMGEDLAVEAMRDGADDYLIKGRLTRLPVAIARAIESAKLRRSQKKALNDLEASEARLREFALYLTNIRERDREVVRKEIHDTIGGSLLAANFALKRLERMSLDTQAASPAATELAKQIHEVEQFVQMAVESSQKLYSGLRTSLLDQGLIPAIEWQMTQLKKRASITPHLATNPNDISLPASIAIPLYDAVRELIENVEKHSGAENIWCAVFLVDDELSIEVRDDGNGCTIGQLLSSRSFGIFAARERVRAIGGTIDFDAVHEGEMTGLSALITVPIPATTEGGDR